MPTPLSLETPELQSNETLKSFDSADSLAKSYLELDSKFKSGSIDVLPEEIRKDPAISVFKNVSELAKGYVETKKMVGGIKKAPDKSDDYKFTSLQNLHPNLKSDGITSALKGVFHKAGLHNEAADVVQQEVLSILSQGMAKSDQDKTELIKKNETSLRQEWGADYDKKLDQVAKILARAGGDEAIKNTSEVAKSLGGSPMLLKALGKIVGLLSEDSIGSLGDTGDKPVNDKVQAQARISEIINMKPNPIIDEKHPDHKKVKEEWDNLHLFLAK